MTDPQQLAETIRRGLRAARDRWIGDERDYDFRRELAVAGLQATEALLARVEAAEHSIACADTPLMRDVMAERDAARARLAQATEALREIASHPLTTPSTNEPEDDPCSWHCVSEIIDAARAALVVVEGREGT